MQCCSRHDAAGPRVVMNRCAAELLQSYVTTLIISVSLLSDLQCCSAAVLQWCGVCRVKT